MLQLIVAKSNAGHWYILDFFQAASNFAQVAMLVVYTATFAGFVIFLVQFINTFTTVSLVHTHLMRRTLLISKPTTASCASLLLQFVLPLLLCTILFTAHGNDHSDYHRIAAHGISNALHSLCGTSSLVQSASFSLPPFLLLMPGAFAKYPGRTKCGKLAHESCS